MKQLILNNDYPVELSPEIGNFSIQYELISKMINYSDKKRIEVIAERFKEITGNEFNLEEESKRKIKRFQRAYKDNEETILFIDGKNEAIRIVTFVKKDLPFDFTENNCTAKTEYSYY